MVWGVGLQFRFGFLILKTTAGQRVLACFERDVTKLISFADEGSRMAKIAGPLVCYPTATIAAILI